MVIECINNVIWASGATAPPDAVSGASINESSNVGIVTGFIQDCIVKIVLWILECVSPLVIWGCKIGIIACILIYYCSGDRKYVGKSMKCGIIFVVFLAIQGALR